MGGEFNFKNFEKGFEKIRITGTHLFGEVPANKLLSEITTDNVFLKDNYFYGPLPCGTNCDSVTDSFSDNCFIYKNGISPFQKCSGINCCFHFQWLTILLFLFNLKQTALFMTSQKISVKKLRVVISKMANARPKSLVVFPPPRLLSSSLCLALWLSSASSSASSSPSAAAKPTTSARNATSPIKKTISRKREWNWMTCSPRTLRRRLCFKIP